MKPKRITPVEKNFLSLSGEEREAIISLGAALRLSYLRNKLFLAESKVQQFEKQYGMTLAKVEAEGIPDNADYRTHEDYIMWHHWDEAAVEIKKDIGMLEKITQHGKGGTSNDTVIIGCRNPINLKLDGTTLRTIPG